MPECQKIEIRTLPHRHIASDITNFTSAVCAVVTQIGQTRIQQIYTVLIQQFLIFHLLGLTQTILLFIVTLQIYYKLTLLLIIHQQIGTVFITLITQQVLVF